MRTFVMGDTHGAHKAMVQCLERCGFDYENDTLIHLGDIADGWSEVYECVEELLKIKNLIPIKGNHDDWFLTWLETAEHPGITQGGRASVDSYFRHCKDNDGYLVIPDSHRKFFRTQVYYYKDDEKRIFVHGGFNRHLLLKEQSAPYIFWWDRDLWHTALSYQAMNKGLVYHFELEGEEEGKKKNAYNFKIKEPCTEIFIGHTTTGLWSQHTPMHAGPIWNLDTGAGFEGVQTIMDVETHEYWQSDRVKTLYPDEAGRRG